VGRDPSPDHAGGAVQMGRDPSPDHAGGAVQMGRGQQAVLHSPDHAGGAVQMGRGNWPGGSGLGCTVPGVSRER